LIIVDASVAVQWIAEEDTSALSDELLPRDDLVGPELLQIEVANALRRKVWVGDMSLDHAKAGLQFVRDKVAILQVPSELLDRALEMSHLMYHPIYDCIYLSLAEKHNAPVVTYDQDFIERAREHGFEKLVVTLPLGMS
jgi:predicted nucleic acid-binding protein